MTYRFHHIHVVCRDLEAMIDFFGRYFNTVLVKRKPFGAAAGAVLDLGGTRLNLRVAQESESPATLDERRAFGYHHIGVTVADVDADYRRLFADGFVFTTPPKDIGDRRIAFFEGPEKLLIELLQPVGG